MPDAMPQDSSASGEHESRPLDGDAETEGASWKNDAIDDSLATLRAEIDAEMKDAGRTKQKALEKGKSLLDELETVLKKRTN